MTARKLALAAVMLIGLVGLLHPAVLVIGGSLFGACYVVAALIRHHNERREEALDVARWIDEHSFSCDRAADVVEYLRGTSLAELRSKVAGRAWRDGYTAASDAERERRSAAARKAAATRRAGSR